MLKIIFLCQLLTIAFSLSNETLNIFNRLSDIRSFDKSGMTSVPNGLALATLGAGTKLTHFRLPDEEGEDPIWFSFDVEFSQVVYYMRGRVVRSQVFHVTEDIDNVLLIDGRSTFMWDTFDYFLYSSISTNKDDDKRIHDLCKLYPSINGFARLFFTYEIVLCNHVHDAGKLKLVMDNNFQIANDTEFPLKNMLDIGIQKKFEPSLKVKPETLLLTIPNFIDDAPSSFNPYRGNMTYFRSNELTDLKQLRSDLLEMALTPPLKNTETVYSHIWTIVSKFTLLRASLLEYNQSSRYILAPALSSFGFLNETGPEHTARCVNFFALNDVIQGQSPNSQTRFMTLSARERNLRKIISAVREVTEYVCGIFVRIYLNDTPKEARVVEMNQMKNTLHWKEFFDCPSECPHNCIRGEFLDDIHCMPGTFGVSFSRSPL